MTALPAARPAPAVAVPSPGSGAQSPRRPSPASPRPGVDLRTGTARAFGTFGELLQGALPGGPEFLVTLPVDRWARARFRLDPGGPLRVFPSHKTKTRRVAEAMLAACGRPAGGVLLLDGDLPVGKGMASSSADLVATVRAVGAAVGLDTSPAEVERWLRPIEPTDGVMHPGVVAFDHREVRLRERLGGLPAATVVGVDEGGLLDTVAFNRMPKAFSPAQRAEYAELLAELGAAVRAGDLARVGTVTTRSAVLNQRLAPKRNLDAVLAIAERVGAAGVVCAHSGTLLGVLLDENDADHGPRLAAALAACSTLPGTTTTVRALTLQDMELSDAA
ncbi:kinase [Kitasatospora sp. NPDC058162]|uniref:GHMP family kinase ATP-binding protein n=1 Tax=Kitasatospora sp. NPDC058162 TaxID=3346362 RepID=UPI0036DB23AE